MKSDTAWHRGRDPYWRYPVLWVRHAQPLQFHTDRWWKLPQCCSKTLLSAMCTCYLLRRLRRRARGFMASTQQHGRARLACSSAGLRTDQPGHEEEDRLILVQKGMFYGYANIKPCEYAWNDPIRLDSGQQDTADKPYPIAFCRRVHFLHLDHLHIALCWSWYAVISHSSWNICQHFHITSQIQRPLLLA